MTYRNILVQVDNSPSGRARAEAAVKTAAKFGAELTGVYLKSEQVPYYIVGDGFVVPTVNVESFAKERAAEIASASSRARAMLDDLARTAGVHTHWLDVNADTDLDLVTYARRHDLSILPVEANADHANHVVSAAKIGLASGGPLLIVPAGGFPKTFGRRVLVAWNNSREAARALRDAMPFLVQAEEIHFLTVKSDAESELDAWLQHHLAIHGCSPAKLVVDSGDDASTGETIRRRIALVGADLIVLGLYGRPMLLELVLGGVTKHLLDHMTMPLLVSH